MKKVHRFVIWICSKFTRKEIEIIITDLQDILSNSNPDVKPKDDFKEKHPNYRNFFVDPKAPYTSPPNPSTKLNYKELLANYKKQHGLPLQPVNPKKPQTIVPKDSICKSCNAPAKYLTHKKVIGIQNLDSESKEFRAFKQIIERLNRTYKSHIRNAYGFKNFNGAIALTSLFVTHYNFIRPHSSLGYSVPIELPELKYIHTFQGKWDQILTQTAEQYAA